MIGSLHLMTAPTSQILTIGGVELTNSRRFIDLSEVDTIRVQFSGSLSVQIDYSLDYGATWNTLVPATSYQGSGGLQISEWQDITSLGLQAGGYSQALLRGIGIGSGLLTTVNFVEIQYQ